MLTPVDIENKEFTKAFRGYETTEVDDFMNVLVSDYEKLYRDNASLKEKNAIISETLENYKGMEATMQNAIMVAQKTSEDIKQNAHDRADTIIKEAEAKAKDIVSGAERKTAEMEKEYSALKKEMTAFKARMNSLLNTYLRLLDDMPENLPKIVLPVEISAPAKEQPIEEEKAEEPAKASDYSENLTDDEKKEEIKTEEPSSSYAPKKINPLVDELLKKKESGNNFADSEDEPTIIAPKEAQKEMIIDLRNNDNTPYDVFTDETL